MRVSRYFGFVLGLILPLLVVLIPAPSDAFLPRGILSMGGGALNPDPIIPAPGTWIRLTDNVTVPQGGFAAVLPFGYCLNNEGANVTACQNNVGGDAAFTANASGTTSLTITSVASGGHIYNGAVLVGSGLSAGTYIESGVTGQNPLVPGSSCIPSCVVTLNQAAGTFTGSEFVANPPMYQASTIASNINCSGWSNIAPYSAPSIDPDRGTSWYNTPGGHSNNCNIIGAMEFDPAAARNQSGPTFAGEINGNQLTVQFLGALNGLRTLNGADSLQIGQEIFGTGVASGTVITGFGTGGGANGTYTVSPGGQPDTGNEQMEAVNPHTVSGWNQVVPPGAQIPLSYPTPAWGNQTADSAASEFYMGKNIYAEYGWQSTHNYNSVNVTSQGYVTAGGIYTGSLGTNINAGYYIDQNYQNTPLGPVIPAPNTYAGTTFYGLLNGYSWGLPQVIMGKAGPDGNIYAEGGDPFNNFVGAWIFDPFPSYLNSPPVSSTSWVIGQPASSSGCFAAFSPGVVISDPYVGGTALALVGRSTQNGSLACSPGGSGGVTHLQVASDINTTYGGSFKLVILSGTSPLTTDCGGSGCGNCTAGNCAWSQTWDPDDGIIIGTDGSRNLEEITPNNTTTWPVGTLTSSSSGTPPPDPTSSACAGISTSTAIQYYNWNGARFIQMVFCGDVYRYGIADPGCPSPTADGAILIGGVGRVNSCYLQDSMGQHWTWTGAVGTAGITSRPVFLAQINGSNSEWNISGGFPTARFGYGYEMELKGGIVYIEQQNQEVRQWIRGDTGERVTGPGGSNVEYYQAALLNGSTPGAQTPNSAVASATSGSTVEILDGSANGVKYWEISPLLLGPGGAASGVRIYGQNPGVAIYASADYYNTSIFNIVSNSNNTILENLELGFNQANAQAGPNNGVNMANNNLNFMGAGLYVHDADNCLHFGGNNGSIILNNVWLNHCGGDTGNGSAAHNAYFSISPYMSDTGDPTNLVANGITSTALRNLDFRVVAGVTGFLWKTRYGNTQVYNSTFAEPDPSNVYNDTKESTVINPSCAGVNTYGAADQSISGTSFTSSGTLATGTLGTVSTTGTATYNSSTGELDIPVPATNYLPGVRFLLSSAAGTGSYAAANGDWVSKTGSGTTLTIFMQPGLTLSLTSATIQYELPYKTGQTFNTSVTATGYTGTYIATATSLTTFTFTIGSMASPATGTYTVPGGVVAELGPDIESGPGGIWRYGDNASGDPYDCPTHSFNVVSGTFNNATGAGTITIDSAVPTWVTPFNNIVFRTVTGTNCTGTYYTNTGLVNLNVAGGEYPTSNYAGLTTFTFTAPVGSAPGCTTITGGTGFVPIAFPSNTLVINNAIIINDSGAIAPAQGYEVPVVKNTRALSYATLTVENSIIIDPYAANLAAALGDATDGGGNTFCNTRAACGYAPFPFIPLPK